MRSTVPSELRRGPFTVADARQFGLTWKRLQTKDFYRLSHGQYVWHGAKRDVELDLRAVKARMPGRFAFSGLTAAWLWGLDLEPNDPIEVTVSPKTPFHARAGIRLRMSELADHDVMTHRGFSVTSPMRTVSDLGSRRDLIESVVAIDMALHARLVSATELAAHVQARTGTKGVRRLRRAAGLADSRSESPMETRLRLHLEFARLPRPDMQADLHDKSGRLLGRADLYYPDVRLVIEYDGVNHKDRFASDARRQNALISAGYHILRFTAVDLKEPDLVAAHVRQARRSLAGAISRKLARTVPTTAAISREIA